MSFQKYSMGLLTLGGTCALGYALMKFTAPSRDDIIGRMKPEERSKFLQDESEISRRNQQLLTIMKENAESSRPAWQVPGYTKKGKE